MHLNWMGLLGGDLKGTLPNPTLKNTGTAGTYVKTTFDAQGRETSGVAGPLGVTDGGTGLSALTLGDTWYASAANTAARLAGSIPVSAFQLLSAGNGTTAAAPVWYMAPQAWGNSANQATFNTTATNIVGCKFTIEASQFLTAFFFVPLRATAGATGCGFNVTVPAGATGALQVFGNTTGATAYTTIYTTAITTNTAKSFCAVATTDLFVLVLASITASATAGTVQLQGQSGAVGTTIQINKGSFTHMIST